MSTVRLGTGMSDEWVGEKEVDEVKRRFLEGCMRRPGSGGAGDRGRVASAGEGTL